MFLRRVVVTGMGLVTPLGAGVEVSWRRLIEGQSGIRRITRFDVDDLPAKIAGLVPTEGEGAFRSDDVMAPKDARKNDLFIIYGVAAATEAVRDADWLPQDEEARERTGVLIGSGIGGLSTIADTAVELEQRGPRRVSPFFIPASLINLVSGQVSIRFGFKGPNHSVVTACSTGAHAIGDASRMIAMGDADVMVAGGAEAAVCRLGIAGFAAARALSTHFNETPERASRPWDVDRDGFVMGEGAGIVVLEELEHARARGARIYGEVVGYGLSGDAYHITAPSPDGDGGYRSMAATTSTPTAPRPRSAMRSSSARSSGCSARPPGPSPCRRPSPRSATCSGPPAAWKRFFHCSPSIIRSCRRPSTWTGRRRPAISISCPTGRANARCEWLCRIPSASVAPTPP